MKPGFFSSVFLSLALLVPALAQAQEVPLLSLEQAITIALDNNYGLRIAEKQQEIVENNITRGNSGMLPQVSLNAGYSRSVNNTALEFAAAPPIEQNGAGSTNANASVNLSQTLFDGFAMFNSYKRLSALGEIGETDLLIRIENTVLQVVNGYYEVVRQQQNLDLAEEAISVSLDRVERQRLKSEFGTGSNLNLLNAQVDLNADSTSLFTNQLTLDNAIRSLNLLMARDPDEKFIVEEKVEFEPLMSLEELVQKAKNRNADIRRARQNQSLSELDYKLSKAARYPFLSLNASYNFTNSTADASFVTSSQNLGVTGGLALTYNLFNGGRTNTQIQNAEIGREAAQLQVESVELQIQQTLTSAYDLYQNRRQVIALEERNLKTAELNFERSRQQYQLGQITNTELRTAQLNLLQTKNRLNNAYFLAKVAETDLLRISGVILD